MKYAPGSFSKNFAWHGTGLRKLHSSIRSGFHSQLEAVDRQAWRNDSGINDRNLELIPINFFLHNRGGQLSVDELVMQAVTKSHSLAFDRLSLFALHLNRAGSGGSVVSRPAMWANEFVREKLWREDAWHTSVLTEEVMDRFIDDRMNAAEVVRTKCRSNYRHLFELCDYIPASLDIINAGSDQWIGPALFLAWDRAILDGGKAAKPDLLDLVVQDELHKLLGTSQLYATQQADGLASLYLEAGNVGRFKLPSSASAPFPAPTPPHTSPVNPPSTAELVEETTSEWIDQEESDAEVQRQTREVQAQIRDRKKAAALRRHYQNTCVFCGARLQVGHNRWYSEAAHVKPLGKPHNGPDRASNMIVLCPNHHLQFDRGILLLKRTPSGFVIRSRIKGDPLNNQVVNLRHTVDEEFVSYHWRWHAVARQ